MITMMNSNLFSNKWLRPILVSAGVVSAATFGAADAATDLSNVPLINATTAVVLPNIMLDLDDSGSMAWDYMPDYVRLLSADDSFTQMCRGIDSDNTLIVCEPGDPPYFANAFNGVYYNPDVRYRWPVNYDGTLKADPNGNTSYSSWNAVASDGYGAQKVDKSSEQPPGTTSCKSWASGGANCPTYAPTETVNLTTQYPERVWCMNASDDPSSANCKSAIDGSTYSYPKSTYSNLKVRYGAPYYYKVSVEWCKNKENSGSDKNFGKAGTCQSRQNSTYKYVRYYNWSRVDITPATVFPAKSAERTDCAGTTCTYAEEMANFATWYAWYRTRTQMIKTSIGLAFKDMRGTPKTGADLFADPNDSDYFHGRIGLTTINSLTKPAPLKLNIANFDTTQKTNFYSKLYSLVPGGGTPLRESLDEMGKMYQGTSTKYADPVQYSCQRNYVILSTDGYWKPGYYGSIGDADGAAGVTKPSYDANHASNTLADIAYYYYHTDLRPGSCSSPDVCTDNVPKSGEDPDVDDVATYQHMTTFTIGLGVDGTLAYQNNYKISKTGDYHDIVQGTKAWPVPSPGKQETVDDLWHAAVNGRGTYFSAKNPVALENGLRTALLSTQSSNGSGAAAATSNLEPTTNDNSIYIATYRTVQWDGEVKAYTIDLSNGLLSGAPTWSTSALLTASGNSDSRTIYTSSGSTRTLFKVLSTAGGLTAPQLAYFDNSNLSQYATWDATQKSAATAELLVNYLRGQNAYEDQDGNAAGNRLYRDRIRVLGDVVHSQPVYVKAPQHNFSDTGYATYKSDNQTRPATLYVAANDGMLHAFNAVTGEERWAYVPPIVLPEMWRLADSGYSSNHHFFLDGPLTISDAYIGGAWKTILIGALGKGGRGYYALDVTDPVDPKPLWTFSASDNSNVGYTYGTPYITKLGNGTWVAVLTSGYNNIPEGGKYAAADGKGYVFVLNLANGNVIKTIPTTEGTVGNPSGLARINIRVADFATNNTAIAAYGGDLLGNMWRFDLDAGTASKLASVGKPIMAGPEIGEVDTKPVIFFGTGRYLGASDLTDVSAQSIFAIRDDGTTTISDMDQLVQQTVSGTGTTRNVSNNPVDWTTKFGWYINFPNNPPDQGERVVVEPQLYFGTLIVASVVPTASDCQPGGYSWLYQLDYRTGGNVIPPSPPTPTPPGATKSVSPIVGVTVAKLPSGTPVIYSVLADGSNPAPVPMTLSPTGSTSGVKRVLWRVLMD